MSNEVTIEQMNEAIARFMCFDKVRVGYFGCDDETEWQRKHAFWMDKVGIESVWCNDWYGHHRIGFDCEWATGENDRAQVLVDALEGLLQWHAQPNNLPAEGLDRRLEAARNALAKWDGKEVECPKCKRAVKEGWACDECSTQV